MDMFYLALCANPVSSIPPPRRKASTHCACHPANLDAIERARLVKIEITKLSFLDHLCVEPSFELHHVQEHLIIRAPGKEDLARIQLVKRAPDAPNVQRRIIWHPHDCPQVSLKYLRKYADATY